MPANNQPPRVERLSKTERTILRALVDRSIKLDRLERELSDLETTAARVLKSCGGSVRVRDLLLSVDHVDSLVYSSKVQDLEARLADLKAKERANGTALADPSSPSVTIRKAKLQKAS